MCRPVAQCERELERLGEMMNRALVAITEVDPLPESVAHPTTDSAMMELERHTQQEHERLRPIADGILHQFDALDVRLSRLCDVPVPVLDKHIQRLENENTELSAQVIAAYEEASALEKIVVNRIEQM